MLLQSFLFWILAVITGVCAIGVVVTQNIVRSATWLLFTLGGVSGIFFLLGADFVAATQLLIYVGGTLVLVVFGVMLTAQRPFISMKTGPAEWAVATVVGLGLYAVLAVSILAQPLPATPGEDPNPQTSMSATLLGEALLGVKEATPEANLPGLHQVQRSRTRIGYLLPFEIVSVHLLIVLIGAAYLARAKRRRGTTT